MLSTRETFSYRPASAFRPLYRTHSERTGRLGALRVMVFDTSVGVSDCFHNKLLATNAVVNAFFYSIKLKSLSQLHVAMAFQRPLRCGAAPMRRSARWPCYYSSRPLINNMCYVWNTGLPAWERAAYPCRNTAGGSAFFSNRFGRKQLFLRLSGFPQVRFQRSWGTCAGFRCYFSAEMFSPVCCALPWFRSVAKTLSCFFQAFGVVCELIRCHSKSTWFVPRDMLFTPRDDIVYGMR